MPEIGDELIYRLREYAESERVRVAEIDARKKTPRYVVEFLDGDKAGTQENVPAGRLRGPWAEAGEYDALMANWERIDQVQLTDVEDSAVGQVFDLLIPDEIAEWEWSPVRYATRIHDRDALREVIGIAVDDLLAQTEGFELHGDLMVSPDATLMIAEYACRLKPMPVLDWVLENEKEYQDKSKHGRPAVSYDKRSYTTSPEWEYQMYLEYGRPLHELLRSWCGQRAATLQERLGAAEAENRRLDELITRLFDELKGLGYARAVDHLVRAYEEERITPASFRPVVDRPLKPSEISVRYERAPRRWGY
jgi:hypothetical protein